MNYLYWLTFAVVAITSAARITRLITIDAFPPAAWVRAKWDQITNENDWALLFHCPYCMSFWVTIAVIGSGLASHGHPAWWVVNGVFGASYLAAIMVRFDGDDD